MDRDLLGRATEGTDAPTPGYLYVDLAKAATANPTACAEMAQYLTRKLQNKQNPNIKAKCCKVISKLAEQVPRNQFRRCIAQDAQAVSAIKEAINFRGPMDPVHGDAKNEKVRVAAREALDAVYNDAPSSETPPGSMPMSAMSASYGSSPHVHGGGSDYHGGGGPRRMEGIGNPSYSDPRLDPRYSGTSNASGFKAAVAEAGEVIVGMIKDPLARNIGQYPDVPNRGHSGNLPGYGPSYSCPPPGAAELSSRTGGQWNMASNRGPAAITGGGPASNEYQKERDTPGGFSSWNTTAGGTSATAGVPGGSWGAASTASRAREPAYGTPSVTINHGGGGGGSTLGGGTSDGTFEKNLILELCPPGGVKPVPPPDKLQQFACNVPNLNADLVCPVLLDFLEEGQPWLIRAKALCVMETAIQNGINVKDATNPYKTFFHACSEEIRPLASHPRAAICEPAKRVLALLGIMPGPSAPSPASAPPPPVATAEAPNLLDFGDDDARATPAAAPPLQPPPPPPPAIAPPVAPPAAAPSMFGGMTVKGTAPVAAVPPPVAAPPRVAASAPPASLLDFDVPGPMPIAAPAVDTAGATSMFGELSVKEEKKHEAVESVSAMPGSTTGSAFSFISNEAPTPTVAKAANFDPLTGIGGASAPHSGDMSMPTAPASGSPNRHQKVLPLSMEQMQAMAYQQMIMQQAQQYQQMQMAMMRGSMPGMPRSMPPQGMHIRASTGTMPGFVPQQLTRVAKKDDKKFDFVKETMTLQKKK